MDTAFPVELKVLDPRLRDWGLPDRQTPMAAALDLRACLDAPLLLHQPEGVEPVRPLLKDVVLGARATQSWPGAKDPEDAAQASRRRMAPAGVPEPEVWGAREPGDPAPADEVVAALQGGRVRRRR